MRRGLVIRCAGTVAGADLALGTPLVDGCMLVLCCSTALVLCCSTAVAWHSLIIQQEHEHAAKPRTCFVLVVFLRVASRHPSRAVIPGDVVSCRVVCPLTDGARDQNQRSAEP